jgi:hypothetical protein
MLVDFSLAAAAEDAQASWLRDIFTKGFRGFATMSTADLLRELQYRDLAGFEDAVAEEDFEDDGEETRIQSRIGYERTRGAGDAGWE